MNDVLGATWITLFGFGVLTQLYPALRHGHKTVNQYGAFLSIILLSSSVPLAFAGFGNKDGIFMAFFATYLAINAWVLALWKFHPLRTRNQVVRTATALSAGVALYALSDYFDLLTNLSVSIASFALAGFIFIKISVELYRAKALIGENSSNRKMPTVSMLIPARNETHALTQNLKSVTATSYNKLEILVADDCSQDDTAQIIRSFAHDGVRFVQGVAPTESWIGKNQAYQLLADEASGDYLVFSGVDTRYSESAMTELITYMHENKLDMVSVMPLHRKLTSGSMLVQPVRYFVMLLLAGDRNPPVLSTVWAIKASSLKRLGGFGAVENSITPESHFARQLAGKGKYQFVVAGDKFGISTYKKPSSQRETAVRYLYPRLHRLVANHLWFSLAFMLLLFYPLLHLTTSIFGAWSLASSFFAASLLATTTAYGQLLGATYPVARMLLAPLLLIAGATAMYWLSLKSLFAYELDNVVWKGRGVCYPVMLNSTKKPRG